MTFTDDHPVGPVRQLKNMFAPIRVWATVIFLASMAVTLVFALVLHSPAAIVFVIIQYAALIWYSASYIPYGRTMIKKCVGNMCGDLGV